MDEVKAAPRTRPPSAPPAGRPEPGDLDLTGTALTQGAAAPLLGGQLLGGHSPTEPVALSDLATRCAELADQPQALVEAAREYANAAQAVGSDLDEAEALYLLAEAAQRTGQLTTAVEAQRREVELRARNGERVSQAYCLNNLGMLLANLGAHADALAALYQCQQLCDQYAEIPDDLRGASNVNLGHLFLIMGQSAKALTFLEWGLEHAQRSHDPDTEVGALGMIGLAYNQLAQYELAHTTLVHAISLARARALRHHLIDLHDNLGQVHLNQGELTQAETMFRQSLYWAADLSDPQGQASALLSLGRLAFQRSEAAQARSHLLQGLEIAGTHDLNTLKMTILEALFSGLEAQGQRDAAYEYLKAFHDLERRMFTEESERNTHSLTARFEAERARRESEMYRQLNETAQHARLQAEETVRVRSAELEAVQIEIVTRLGMAAEYRDDKSGQHTRRVGELSAQLAQALGLPPDEVDLLRWAARLHDIGKIGVGDDILLKSGRYTAEEFERMKLHTVIGAKVLEGSTSKLLRMAEEIALTHHERWDGAGYPRGLSGTDIPISGRIVAVADVFDALTTQRPYKEAWTVSDALSEMQRQAGEQFDPEIIERLVMLMGQAPGGQQPKLGLRLAPAPPPSAPPELQEARELLERAWTLKQSDPRLGQELAGRGMALARTFSDEHTLGLAHRTTGFYCFYAGAYEEALAHLSQGLDIGILCDDRGLQADCANFIAAVYSSLNDYEKATDQLAVVLRLARDNGDDLREAHCLHNLAVLNYKNRDLPKAKEYAQESLLLYRTLDSHSGLAMAHGTLATICYDLGETELALSAAQTAIQQAEAAGMGQVHNLALNQAGRAAAKLGDVQTGKALLERSIAHAQEIEFTAQVAHNEKDLGYLYQREGELVQARAHYEKALRISRAAPILELDLELYLHLSEVCALEGRHQEALELYRLHHDVEREMFDQTAALKTRALMTQLDVERAKSEAQIYRLKTIELANANEALERVNSEKSSLVHMLEEQSRLLERQLSEDGLTGLHNRKHIEGMLQHEFLNGRTTGQSLCVAMADIDHFKQINDRFSHMIGDQVLRTVAQLFQSAMRPTDGIGRFGGEEFLFVFPRTTLPQGLRVCERVQELVRHYDWSQIHPNLQVTLSIGLAASLNVLNHEKLISLADEQLYRAKNGGRDQICLQPLS